MSKGADVMARLGEAFVLIRNGASIKQTEGAGGIPITRIETISNREVDRNKFGYAGILDIQKYSDYILQDEDILMSHINSEKHLGKAAIYKKAENEQVIHGMNLLVLRADPQVIYPKYALYYFETPFFQQKIMKITKKSVNQASFTVTALKDIDVLLPTLEMQRSVATVLDKLSGLIALRRQQIAKLDELVKARFVEMFGDPVNNAKGWNKPTLSECLSGIENGKSFVCGSEPRQGNWPAVLKLSAVTYGLFRPKENKAVLNMEDFLQTAEVKTGDLLFTRKNTPELVGMSAYVFETEPCLMMPDLIFRLNTNKKCDKIFLWQLINHDLFRPSISNLSSGSAKSMSNISKERLSGLQIICPPLEMQQVFATFVRQVYRQKLKFQQSLDHLEMLRKSLMQDYFM